MTKKPKVYSRECKYCGDNFDSKTKVRQKFCNDECRNNYHYGTKRYIPKVCKCCGKEFEVNHTNNKKIFCNSKCRDTYNNMYKKPKVIECPNCKYKFNL